MPQQTGAADDWADYQVQVPDETGAFRIAANVASLGRDVTFFAALSNFVPGIPAGFTRATTDPTASQAAPAVVASPSVPALAEGVAETAMPATDASQATTGEAAGSASVGSADGSGVSTAQPQGSAVSSSPTVIVLPIQQHQPVTAAPATTEAAAEEAQGVATTDGAREYDVEGNEVGAGAPVAAGGVVVPVAALVVGGVVVVAVAGGLVWLLGFYRPRRLQRERDAVAALDGALPPTSAVLPDDPEDDEAPAHYVPSPYEVPAAEGVPGGTGADQTPDPDAAVTQIVLDATTQLPNPVAAPGQKGEAEQGEAEGDAAPGATDGGREA